MLDALTRTVKPALKRRFVLAAVVGGVVFATVYAFAATLSVSSQQLGAGNVGVSACATQVKATYAVSYAAALPGYKVDSVALDHLTSCSGQTISLDLTGAANASIFHTTYNVLPADATAGSAT